MINRLIVGAKIGIYFLFEIKKAPVSGGSLLILSSYERLLM